MSSDFNFTVASWFLGNVRVKPYFNTQWGEGTRLPRPWFREEPTRAKPPSGELFRFFEVISFWVLGKHKKQVEEGRLALPLCRTIGTGGREGVVDPQILARIEAEPSSKGLGLLFTPHQIFRPSYDPAMVFLRKPHLVLQGPFNQHNLQLSTIYTGS